MSPALNESQSQLLNSPIKSVFPALPTKNKNKSNKANGTLTAIKGVTESSSTESIAASLDRLRFRKNDGDDSEEEKKDMSTQNPIQTAADKSIMPTGSARQPPTDRPLLLMSEEDEEETKDRAIRPTEKRSS